MKLLKLKRPARIITAVYAILMIVLMVLSFVIIIKYYILYLPFIFIITIFLILPLLPLLIISNYIINKGLYKELKETHPELDPKFKFKFNGRSVEVLGKYICYYFGDMPIHEYFKKFTIFIIEDTNINFPLTIAIENNKKVGEEWEFERGNSPRAKHYRYMEILEPNLRALAAKGYYIKSIEKWGKNALIVMKSPDLDTEGFVWFLENYPKFIDYNVLMVTGKDRVK